MNEAVLQYLKTRLQPLSIEIKTDYARNLFDLMQEGYVGKQQNQQLYFWKRKIGLNGEI